jgi:hypothetical protein
MAAAAFTASPSSSRARETGALSFQISRQSQVEFKHKDAGSLVDQLGFLLFWREHLYARAAANVCFWNDTNQRQLA